MMNSRNMSRHKQLVCMVCGEMMRSDHLSRHMKTHNDLEAMNPEEKKEELLKRKEDYLRREAQRLQIERIAFNIEAPSECYAQSLPTLPKPILDETVKEEMTRRNEEYLEKIDIGRQVYDVLLEGVVREGSLSSQHKEALDLFRKESSVMNVGDIQLRTWQCDLLEKIKVPSEREVIWVRGVKGNEGKSWFQTYVQSLYGLDRVVRLDIKARQQDLMHALAKRPLTNTDIFLFNMPRSFGETKSCSYGAIEGD